jgi:hypothetical protein
MKCLLSMLALTIALAFSGPVLADNIGAPRGPADHQRLKCESGTKWDYDLMMCVPQ